MPTFPLPARTAAAALAVIGTAAATAVGVTADDTPPTTSELGAQDVRAASLAAVRPAPPLTDPAVFDTEIEQLKAAAPQPAPQPEPAPEPHVHAPAPAPAPTAPTGSVWDRLARCESSGNWASTVGTYEGGLQFHPRTWDAYKPAGYPEAAYQASREQQIAVAESVLAAQGWGAWPACSRKLGLR